MDSGLRRNDDLKKGSRLGTCAVRRLPPPSVDQAQDGCDQRPLPLGVAELLVACFRAVSAGKSHHLQMAEDFSSVLRPEATSERALNVRRDWCWGGQNGVFRCLAC